METIYDAGRRVFEAARWDTLQVGNTDDCIEMFKEGVEFAQRWIQIDRCTNGYITAHSLSDIERNLPVIMNDEDEIENEEYIVIR